METLGEFIKAERKKSQITTTELAEAIGVSQGYISHLENNRKKNPSPDLLQKISHTLGIDHFVLMKKAGYILSTGQRIKEDREAAGLSIEELAKRTGISGEYLEKVENEDLDTKLPHLIYTRILHGINLPIPEEANATFLKYEDSDLSYLDLERMTHEQRKNFGAMFNANRVNEGITLEDMAMVTKIPIQDLIDLESGELIRNLTEREYSDIINNYRLFDFAVTTPNSDYELRKLILFDERVNFKGRSLNDIERQQIYESILNILN